MNNAINMLPCPMCGCTSINVKNEQPTDNSGGYFIECPDCGISTSLRYACGDDPIPLLAEQWNRRATAQCLHQIAEPQAEAMRLADECEESATHWVHEIDTRFKAAKMLRAQHARIAELEADNASLRGINSAQDKALAELEGQLEAIGAGGVESLRKRDCGGCR
jgi:hypothetical protein